MHPITQVILAVFLFLLSLNLGYDISVKTWYGHQVLAEQVKQLQQENARLKAAHE